MTRMRTRRRKRKRRSIHPGWIDLLFLFLLLVRIRVITLAARQFLTRPDRARAGAVDVEVLPVLGVCDQRMRVRTTTGLHGGHLLRLLEVADVEDAHPAE